MTTRTARFAFFAAVCGLGLVAGCPANRVESSTAAVKTKSECTGEKACSEGKTCSKAEACCNSAKTCTDAAKN